MSREPAIRTVTIVGVGLIGGSFALALRQAGFQGRILGVSSPGTITQARASGVIDSGVSLSDGAEQADLVFLSAPVGAIIEQLPVVAKRLKPGALVTDAGSTKRRIALAARAAFTNPHQFLGGHPMAGKETHGVAAATASLFADRSYILMPPSPECEQLPVYTEFLDFLHCFGCKLFFLDPETHDRLIAFSSHLPQLASTVLAAVVGNANRPTEIPLQAVSGSGLHDMTRLALSSYEIWKDILQTNCDTIATALDIYIESLQRLRNDLGTQAAGGWFEEGARTARDLRRID